jgi:hypothetical protein
MNNLMTQIIQRNEELDPKSVSKKQINGKKICFYKKRFKLLKALPTT